MTDLVTEATPISQSLFTLAEFEREARARTPKPMFDALFGAVGGQLWDTNTNNVNAFARLPLRPRVMTGISTPNISTTVLGREIALPVMAAPSGSHQRVHALGELATAAGTAKADTVMGMSTVANFSIEEVGEATNGPKWFQLYVFRDRAISSDLIRRAEAAGFEALIITVDNVSGRLGSNERARFYGYSWADEVKTSATLEKQRILRNFRPYESAGDDTERRFERQSLLDYFDTELSWKDLEWLRSVAKLPIVVKGIQTAEDARLATKFGADAIIVSNHGGAPTDVDGLPGTLTLLPEIVEATGDGIEIYLDGGIRHGVDVLKALSLGARAVFIGRAVQWGLIVDGADGVARVFEVLARELQSAMGLCGVADARTVSRATVGSFGCPAGLGW